jgi:hypothetical protein
MSLVTKRYDISEIDWRKLLMLNLKYLSDKITVCWTVAIKEGEYQIRRANDYLNEVWMD